MTIHWLPRSLCLAGALALAGLLSSAAQATPPGPGTPEVATAIPDGSGGMIVASYGQRAGGAFADLYVQKVNAAGVTQWTTLGAVLCTTADVSRSPVLASDGAGGVILAWLDFRGPFGIYVQRVNSAGVPLWTAGGVQLCTTAHSSGAPEIVADAAGGAIVAWRDSRSDNGDIYVQRVNASGAIQWLVGGLPVCTATAAQTNPAVAGDGAGGVVMAWADSRNGNTDVYAQHMNASGVPQWTANGVPVCTAAGSQMYKRIVADGAGGLFATWADLRSGTADIYAQRLNGSGVAQWAADGVSVCAATGEQTWPALTADGAGGIVLTWQDLRGGTDYDIYVQRVNGGGVAQWTANGVALCSSAGNQTEQVIAPDGSGGAIVAWTSATSATAPRRICAQRVNASGTPQWAANGVAVCPGRYYDAAEPTIVSDQAGGTFVGWTESSVGEEEVYGQRLTGAGALAWGTAGVGLVFDPGVQRWSAGVPDGSGGTIVTWMERLPGQSSDIFARRVLANGSIAWAKAAVCTASGDQIWPAIASDGSGGALIAWVDLRNGLDVGIYAQRLNASGVAQWTANGVSLYAGTGVRFGLGIASDGSGGAIACWQDLRGVDFDIYAQRVNAAGSVQWTSSGVAVCTAAGDQTLSGDEGVVDVVSDGSSGVYLAWLDSRSGNRDIYAQRIGSGGAPLWTANGEVVCNAAGTQESQSVAFDTFSPGLFVVWQDYRSGNDVYSQRMTPSGATSWATGGVVVEGGGYDGYNPRVVADGLGGALYAWYGFGGTDENVWAQRLNAVGSPLWTVNGVTVCGASGAQRKPEIIPDANSGVIVTWEDRRGGVGNEWMDLYAQRLNSQGALLWPADGVAVCNATNTQALPSITLDDAGGAIVSWQDRRNGSSDVVYSQRLSAAGAPLWATGGVTTSVPHGSPVLAGLGLGAVGPNPARGPLTIAFTLPGDEPAALDLMDVAGRRVASRTLAGFGAGSHVVTWAHQATLTPGMYVVLLRQGGQTQARKVCVLR